MDELGWDLREDPTSALYTGGRCATRGPAPRPCLRALQICATPLSRPHRPCARWYWIAKTPERSRSSIDSCWAFTTARATNPADGTPDIKGQEGLVLRDSTGTPAAGIPAGAASARTDLA